MLPWRIRHLVLFTLAISVVAVSIRDVSVSRMPACAYAAQDMRSSFREPIPVAFKAITIPKIDGEYDAALVKTTDSAGNTIMVDEWNDTQRQRMRSYFANETAGGSAIAYFSMKFDESYLYVLVDFPMTKTNWLDRHYSNTTLRSVKIGAYSFSPL